MKTQKKLTKLSLFLLLAMILGMSQLSDSYAATASSTITVKGVGLALKGRYCSNTPDKEKSTYKEMMDTLKQKSRRYARISDEKGVSSFRTVTVFLSNEMDTVYDCIFRERPTFAQLTGSSKPEEVTSEKVIYAFQGMLENIENLLQIAFSTLR